MGGAKGRGTYKTGTNGTGPRENGGTGWGVGENTRRSVNLVYPNGARTCTKENAQGPKPQTSSVAKCTRVGERKLTPQGQEAHGESKASPEPQDMTAGKILALYAIYPGLIPGTPGGPSCPVRSEPQHRARS